MQAASLHQATQRLYLLMHQGDFYSYEAPGTEIWVYDLASQARLAKISPRRPSISIAVSQDDNPLLYAITEDMGSLDVYDAGSGEHLRSAGELGITPALIEPVPLP